MENNKRIGYCREMARKTLKDSGIVTPPIDLIKIINQKGYIYLELETFPDKIDALFIEKDGTKYAAVNKRHHPHRRRFSLAHELGHIVLFHKLSYYTSVPVIDAPPEEPYTEHKIKQKIIEAEANEYAGELLVPLSFLKEACKENNDLDYLSGLFNVSKEVIIIKLTSHRLI